MLPRHCLPLVPVPEQHSHVVDDALHPQLDDNPLLLSLVDRVSGESPLHVVVLRVPVQEGVLHLPDQDLRPMLLLGNILLVNYNVKKAGKN